MTTWSFGCDAWMFGDGTYTHIEVGHELHASVEFWEIGQLSPVEPRPLNVEPTSGRARYKIVGQVLLHDDEFFVLDLGVLQVSCISHQMSRFSDLRPGDFVAGKVALALNPFDWDPDTHPRRMRLMVEAITKENYKTSRRRRPKLVSTEPVDAITGETVDDRASYLITGDLITSPN